MTAPLKSLPFDASLLDRLACPACHGSLELTLIASIECSQCQRVYPLVDGIPVLISERTSLLKDDPAV